MLHLKRWHIYVLFFVFIYACGNSRQQEGFTIDKISDPMQQGSYVSNPDHLISDATSAELNEQMRKLDESGRAQVAIVLLQTIGDKVAKDVAHEIFRMWHPGHREKNNGLVVLLVNDQHRIEFETGYGLEGDLPDVICFRIQQSEMLPSFKANDIDKGMLKGMMAVANVLQPADAVQEALSFADTIDAAVAEEAQSEDTTDAEASLAVDEHSFSGLLILYLLYALFATIFVVKAPLIKKHNDLPVLFNINIWHRVWVYGLPLIAACLLFSQPDDIYRELILLTVMYLTLLAYLCYRTMKINQNAALTLSGSERDVKYDTLNAAHANSWLAAVLFPLPLLVYKFWHNTRLRKLRYAPYQCKICRQPMHRLNKGKRRKALDTAKAVEDTIGSVVYDVWTCGQGHTNHVVGYRNLRTNATRCPSCNALTLLAGSKRTVRKATAEREGSGIRTYVCKHCRHTIEKVFVIPRVSTSSSSSSGSSSSSSSSGNWGGGDSGGGGAGSDW